MLAEALAKRGHKIVLSLDRVHLETAGPISGVSSIPLDDLDRAAISSIIARAATARSPRERSRAVYHTLVGCRERTLVARIAELMRSNAFELVVVCRALLVMRGVRLSWPTPTAIVAYTSVTAHGSRPLSSLPCLRLAALDPLVIPKNQRYEGIWQYTGFWTRPKARGRKKVAEEFLEKGAAPFFLTMGSMLGFNARALTSAFVTAARRRGRRVIIQRGWAGLNFRGASDVLVVDEIDYAAVLPRCEAQFLHGGAGTVTAALRSGRPIALLPVMPDQVFWAKCLRHLGVCFGTLDPFSVLPQDFERLMRRELMNPKYRKAALEISARLAQNDGLSTACSALEEFASAAVKSRQQR